MTFIDGSIGPEQERKLARTIRELIAAYADLDDIAALAKATVDDYRQYDQPAPVAAEDLESEL
jgi:hypothetical protein